MSAILFRSQWVKNVYLDVKHHQILRRKSSCNDGLHKTAVFPLLMQWRYCSLVLSHWCELTLVASLLSSQSDMSSESSSSVSSRAAGCCCKRQDDIDNTIFFLQDIPVCNILQLNRHWAFHMDINNMPNMKMRKIIGMYYMLPRLSMS